MMCGNVPKPGDVILTYVPFVDSREMKKRPAVVLFQDLGNVVAAGVTSNLKMKGIPLSKSEGAIRDSVIKLNYIFTISEGLILKTMFSLNPEKRQLVFDELNRKLAGLKA